MTEVDERLREILFRIHDIGGIEDLEIRLRAGRLNLVRGGNGVGKTSAILAMLRALGDDTVDLEIRDGAPLGTIDVERIGGPAVEDDEERRSRIVVPAKGRIRTQGEPPMSPADVRAVTQLITGDHDKGVEPRARKRIEAFLQIVRPKLDEPSLALLCERDQEMMAWLSERVASGQVTDLLGAAEKLKTELQRRAREKEDSAKAWEGQEASHLDRATKTLDRLKGIGQLEAIAQPDPEEARSNVETMARRHADVERDARARVTQEARQAEIRAASTARPDVDAAEQLAKGYAAEFQAARAEATQIEQEIAILQERLVGAISKRDNALAQGRQAEGRWKEAQSAAAQWDGQQALLQKAVTGATPADVELAGAALEESRRQADIHRLSAEFLSARAEGDEAAKKRAREADRGKQLRQWSKAIPARVADVLARQGAGSFTVLDGHLAYRLGGGEALDFDTRLSTGQQIAAAFELAASRFNGFVYIAPEFYSALDVEHRVGIDDFAAEHPELFVVTEEATAGDLLVVHGIESQEENPHGQE